MDGPLLNLLGNLAAASTALGHIDRAECLHAQSLALAEAAFGPDSPKAMFVYQRKGVYLRMLGRSTEAGDEYQRLVAIGEQVFGPDDVSPPGSSIAVAAVPV